jgi:hypothetical protein
MCNVPLSVLDSASGLFLPVRWGLARPLACALWVVGYLPHICACDTDQGPHGAAGQPGACGCGAACGVPVRRGVGCGCGATRPTGAGQLSWHFTPLVSASAISLVSLADDAKKKGTTTSVQRTRNTYRTRPRSSYHTNYGLQVGVDEPRSYREVFCVDVRRSFMGLTAAWGKMLKIGTQGVGTGSDFFYQAPYIKAYLSVLSLLFQGMVGGQHRTSPYAGELLARGSQLRSREQLDRTALRVCVVDGAHSLCVDCTVPACAHPPAHLTSTACQDT